MIDLAEWRTAVADMTETERATNCGHTCRSGWVCPDCGNEVGWDE